MGRNTLRLRAAQAGHQATAEEIIAFCRDQLAHFKAPKSVIFGPLPTTATGKIQKFVLREQARSTRDLFAQHQREVSGRGREWRHRLLLNTNRALLIQLKVEKPDAHSVPVRRCYFERRSCRSGLTLRPDDFHRPWIGRNRGALIRRWRNLARRGQRADRSGQPRCDMLALGIVGRDRGVTPTRAGHRKSRDCCQPGSTPCRTAICCCAATASPFRRAAARICIRIRVRASVA